MSSEKEKLNVVIDIPTKLLTDELDSTGKRKGDSALNCYSYILNCQLYLPFFVFLIGFNIFSFNVLFQRMRLELDYVQRMQRACCIQPKVMKILFLEDTSKDSKNLSMQITEKVGQVITKENYFKTEKQPVEKKMAYFDSPATDIEHDEQNGHNRKMSLKSYMVLKNLENIEIEPVIDESKDVVTSGIGKLRSEDYIDIHKGMQKNIVHPDSAVEDNMPVIEEVKENNYNLEITLPDNEDDDDYEMNEGEED